MGNWFSVSQVFQGGTQQVVELAGKKVKANTSIPSVRLFDVVHPNKIESKPIPVGLIGWLTGPNRNANQPEVLIAFPNDPKIPPQSLRELERKSDFYVISIDEVNFKDRFYIEK
jgi:hypothetical protein